MRIAVDIDDQLLAEAQELATSGLRSLDDVINDALRFALGDPAQRSPSARRMVLPVDGDSGLLPGIDLEDRQAMADAMGDGGPVHQPVDPD